MSPLPIVPRITEEPNLRRLVAGIPETGAIIVTERQERLAVIIAHLQAFASPEAREVSGCMFATTAAIEDTAMAHARFHGDFRPVFYDPQIPAGRIVMKRIRGIADAATKVDEEAVRRAEALKYDRKHGVRAAKRKRNSFRRLRRQVHHDNLIALLEALHNSCILRCHSEAYAAHVMAVAARTRPDLWHHPLIHVFIVTDTEASEDQIRADLSPMPGHTVNLPIFHTPGMEIADHRAKVRADKAKAAVAKVINTRLAEAETRLAQAQAEVEVARADARALLGPEGGDEAIESIADPASAPVPIGLEERLVSVEFVAGHLLKWVTDDLTAKLSEAEAEGTAGEFERLGDAVALIGAFNRTLGGGDACSRS